MFFLPGISASSLSGGPMHGGLGEEHGSVVLQGKEKQKHRTFGLQHGELGTLHIGQIK